MSAKKKLQNSLVLFYLDKLSETRETLKQNILICMDNIMNRFHINWNLETQFLPHALMKNSNEKCFTIRVMVYTQSSVNTVHMLEKFN